VLAEEWPRISAFPATAAVFGNGEGGHLRAGHVLRQPLLAQTLEKIAAGGAAAFYTGELSRSWLSEAGKLGVKITPEDLAAYRVRASKPVEFKIFGLRALTAPPPSASGLMVAGSLRYLERYYREHDAPAPGSAARMIVTAEALRYFQELRNTNLADPPHGTLDPAKFLGSPEEKKAWAEIDKRVQNRLDHIQTKFTRLPSEPLKGHTAHLSIADDHGMAVAYTTTIEEWFGSGMVVTGHGFLLNNELSDFAGEPGHPNSPAPGKRPRSNMSPTLLFAGDKAVGVVGCAGGGRIPTAIVELLENYYIHKMTAREAIAFPRFHPDGDTLQLDRSVPDSVAAQLKSAGYDVKVDPVGGVAQALLRRAPKDAWEVASEPRSDGLGFAWEKGGGR
jgi:gamma-glutamyltranspeptidase/glutathione hydrolase